MAETTTTPRLMAAAKEFNIGKDTLVDFLESKGFNRDDLKPTAKLTEDMYRALQAMYKSDKVAKMKSEQIDLPRAAAAETRRKRDEEDISIRKEEKLYSYNSNDLNLYEAWSRVKRCLITKDTQLDLSNLKINSLPPDIIECKHIFKLNLSGNTIKNIELLNNLPNLKSLNLSDNDLDNVDSMQGLTRLSKLDLSNNKVQTIEPLISLPGLSYLDLSRNRVNNLQELSALANLTTIKINNNDINDIKFVKHLKRLQKLHLRKNKISDIEQISNLKNILVLDLSYNEIEDLEPIKQLSKLRHLFLSGNKLVNIEPLSNLTNIITLALDSNQIHDISPLELLCKKKRANKKINIAENPFEEIKLGTDTSENHYHLLYEYFLRISKYNSQLVPLNLTQLLILGNGRVGKTSLLRSLRDTYAIKENKNDDSLTSEIPLLPEESTHGTIHYYWNFNLNNENTTFTLLVKDFGGQEYYHHFHPIFYHSKAIYLIVTAPQSSTDYKDDGNFSPIYWHKNINHYLQFHHQEKKEEISINSWLIQNKIDENDSSFLNHKEQSFKKTFKICSLNSDKLNKLNDTTQNKFRATREYFYYELIDHLTKTALIEKINSFSLDIFNKLRSLIDEEKASKLYFTKTEFKNYLTGTLKFDKTFISENFETILIELRYLGICLFFPSIESLSNTIYLHPKQLSEKMFQKVLKGEAIQSGVINGVDLEEEQEIKQLLEHFEVIFFDLEKNNWIVPQYLPKIPFDIDLINLVSEGIKEELTLCFDDFMPQGIMSRLICYFGKNPFKKWYWRDGIFFTHNLCGKESKSLIIAEWNNGFQIKIKAETKIELEAIFLKVLLSYYNKPLSLNDCEINESNSDLNNAGSKFLVWEDFVKQNDIDLSISLNNGPKIPLQDFKQWIKAEKATFYHIPVRTSSRDQLWDASSHLVKIYDYLPIIKHLIETKDFESGIKPKKIFISYSHADSDVRNKLESHFKLMERAGIISNWYDLLIDIGTKWDLKIETELKQSDIIILLISDNFFSSDYIWSKEFPIIEEKINQQTALVIPILCRHCLWSIKEPFKGKVIKNDNEIRFNISSLQGLPVKNSKLTPIHSESYPFKDEAYAQISEKLFELIQKGIEGVISETV